MTAGPLPIRVLVKGASLMHEISEFPQKREDFVFSRVIEEQLLLAGYGANVWTAAVASEPTSHAFRTWEEQVKAWSPDVVILSYGYYEVIHLFLPRWLERHANSLAARPGRVRSFYRKNILRKIWMTLAKTQAAVDRRVGARFFAGKVKKVETELRAFIDKTRRKAGEPLVMLFEFLPTGARGQDWFPGMSARTAMMNEMLHRLVAEYDNPEILLVPIPAIAERADPGQEPNTDGFHYTAVVHRAIGEEIAEEIITWAKQYPRLAPRD